MKKHLIAAAVAAAVAVPAAAQVTISGGIDYGWDVKNKTTAATTTTNAPTTAGGNRVGNSQITLTATEDLGGGLKATAVTDHALDAANVITARDQFVELAGGFGTFRIGRLDRGFNAGYGNYAVAISTNGVGSSDSTGHDLMGGTLGRIGAGSTPTYTTSTGGTFARQNGVIQYTTPKFMGATLLIETARNKSEAASANANTKAEMTNYRIDYAMGKLTASVGVGSRKVDASTANNIQDEAKANYIGLAYDLGMAQIKFAQGNRKDTDDGATSADVTVNNFNITVPMGAISFRAGFYDGKDKVTDSATDDMDLRGHQIGAIYSLSKRTSLYAYVGKNETKLSTGGTTNLEKSEATYVGVNHRF
jgi:predicted porin